MMQRYKQGELAPDTPKAGKEPMAIDPNSKVNQGAMSGDGNDAKGKSKSKVDPAIFRMSLNNIITIIDICSIWI